MADDHDHDHDLVPDSLYRNGVDLSEPGAVNYWCAKFGCKPAVLTAAVLQAGSSSVAAVRGAVRSILKLQQRWHEPDDCSP